MVAWGAHLGHFFTQKILKNFIVIAVEDLPINFHFSKHQNQSLFLLLKFKTLRVDKLVHFDCSDAVKKTMLVKVMPGNLFGITSRGSSETPNTSSSAQKPYLGTTYIESEIEENVDLERHFKNYEFTESCWLSGWCLKVLRW